MRGGIGEGDGVRREKACIGATCGVRHVLVRLPQLGQHVLGGFAQNLEIANDCILGLRVIEELTVPHCCVVEDSVDGIPHMRKIHAVIFQSNFLSGNHLEIQCRIN